VKRLRVAENGVARAGEPLVEIVPYDEMLVIEGRVRPADIAYVRLGRPVRVTIAADDRAAAGALEGSVFEISREAVSPETRGETYFRIKVRTKSRPESGGKAVPIGPGMPAQIAIKLGETTLLTYMLKPFAGSVRPIDSDDADPEMPSAESL
jgi:adhesin transport system membrane fusion protein